MRMLKISLTQESPNLKMASMTSHRPGRPLSALHTLSLLSLSRENLVLMKMIMTCLVKCLTDECVLTLILCSGYCPHSILKTLQAGFDPVQNNF